MALAGTVEVEAAGTSKLTTDQLHHLTRQVEADAHGHQDCPFAIYCPNSLYHPPVSDKG